MFRSILCPLLSESGRRPSPRTKYFVQFIGGPLTEGPVAILPHRVLLIYDVVLELPHPCAEESLRPFLRPSRRAIFAVSDRDTRGSSREY